MDRVTKRRQRLSTRRVENLRGRLQISVELSWTHYRLLSKVHQPDARRYYLHGAVAGRWSTRELERQILTRHFERGLTVASTPSSELPVFEAVSAVSVLRDPYVLEFLGLPDRLVNDEAELEQALIDQLQAFLLELGRGFSFVGRQQRASCSSISRLVNLTIGISGRWTSTCAIGRPKCAAQTTTRRSG